MIYWYLLPNFLIVLKISIVFFIVTGIIHIFGNDNSNRRISCSSIDIGGGNGIIIMF